MTKSTITRERAQQIFLGNGPEPSASEERELARMALAAMDSEPDCKERKLFCSTDTTRMRKTISVSAGTEDAPLYRHAQQPVVSADLLHMAASAIEDLLTTKDRTGAGVWFDLPFRLRSAANAQPAPVVPEEIISELEQVRDWILNTLPVPTPLTIPNVRRLTTVINACRAAMLQAGTLTNEGTKQAWTGIPDIDNAINMLDRIDTLESCDDDRVEAVKTVLRRLAGNSPAIPDGYVMVPINMTTEQMRAVQRDSTLGTFASAHLKGAFDLYREFWSVAVAASPQEVRKSNVVDTYQGADGKEHEIIYLTSSQKEVK